MILGRPRDATMDTIHRAEPGFQRGEITEDRFLESIIKELDSETPVENLRGVWGMVYARETRRIDGTLEIANRLRKSGYITGVISNTENLHVEEMRKMGLLEGFSSVVLSCEVGLRKPDKGIFKIALEMLGMPAKRVVYTDDNEKKLEGARRLGIESYVFDNAQGLEKWLKGRGLVF